MKTLQTEDVELEFEPGAELPGVVQGEMKRAIATVFPGQKIWAKIGGTPRRVLRGHLYPGNANISGSNYRGRTEPVFREGTADITKKVQTILQEAGLL